MGRGSFGPSDWDGFLTKHDVAKKSATHIFSSTARKEFNPVNIECREACETSDKPQITPIIVALDVTGSMGKIPHELIKEGLGTLMEEIQKRGSIPNPQLMFMAIGDVEYDQHPLQVTQFESDIRIAEQLRNLYLEGGGGGNDSESYTLAWDFAAHKTKLDCFEKRGEKGLLFTIGDECLPQGLSGEHRKAFVGIENAENLSSAELYANISKIYDVFHVCVKSTRHDHFTLRALQTWEDCIGKQNIISVEAKNYTKIPEVIVSTIDLLRGKKTKEAIASSWNKKDTQLAVADALKNLSKGASVHSKNAVYRPGRTFSTVARPLPSEAIKLSTIQHNTRLFKPDVAYSALKAVSHVLKMTPK
jgi:hypothetical protein